MEGRLEAAEIRETTFRENLERESERADLDAERARRNEGPRGAWHRLFGR